MPTCKNCIHKNCRFMQYGEKCDKWQREHGCINFKDRSKFIELPCEVGDRIFYHLLGTIYCESVKEFKITEQGVRFVLRQALEFDTSEIGKNFFLTREEAEQALKEREV